MVLLLLLLLFCFFCLFVFFLLKQTQEEQECIDLVSLIQTHLSLMLFRVLLVLFSFIFPFSSLLSFFSLVIVCPSLAKNDQSFMFSVFVLLSLLVLNQANISHDVVSLSLSVCVSSFSQHQ